MTLPEFTDEQQAWLADMLTPRCCHVSGSHDPVHFEEGRYVCGMQMTKRYIALRVALGLPTDEDGHPLPGEAVSDPSCGWCQRAAS